MEDFLNKCLGYLAKWNKDLDDLGEPKKFYTTSCLIFLPGILARILISEPLMWIWFILALGCRIWWVNGNLENWLPEEEIEIEEETEE